MHLIIQNYFFCLCYGSGAPMYVLLMNIHYNYFSNLYLRFFSSFYSNKYNVSFVAFLMLHRGIAIIIHRQGHPKANWTNWSQWAPHLSYLLSVVQVYTTTHCRFYWEQLGPAPPKDDPAWCRCIQNTAMHKHVFSLQDVY